MAERTRPRGSSTRDPGPKVTPKADVYVGLLAISLALQIAGAVFLYLDYSQYPDTKPPAVRTDLAPAPGAGGAPGAAAPGAPGTVPGAGAQGMPPGAPGGAPGAGAPAPAPAPGTGMMGGAPKP